MLKHERKRLSECWKCYWMMYLKLVATQEKHYLSQAGWQQHSIGKPEIHPGSFYCHFFLTRTITQRSIYAVSKNLAAALHFLLVIFHCRALNSFSKHCITKRDN